MVVVGVFVVVGDGVGGMQGSAHNEVVGVGLVVGGDVVGVGALVVEVEVLVVVGVSFGVGGAVGGVQGSTDAVVGLDGGGGRRRRRFTSLLRWRKRSCRICITRLRDGDGDGSCLGMVGEGLTLLLLLERKGGRPARRSGSRLLGLSSSRRQGHVLSLVQVGWWWWRLQRLPHLLGYF